jgi:MFS family permease
VTVGSPASNDDSSATRRLTWRYAAVTYAATVLLAGAGIPAPLYGIYRHELAFSVAAQTFVFAIYTVVLVPCLVAFSALIRRVPHYWLAAGGLLVAILADVVFMAAGSLGDLLVARGLQGMAIGAASAATGVLFVETHPRADHRRAALASTLATAAGLGCGALVAGVLAEYGPQPLQLVFQLHLVLLAIATVLIFVAAHTSSRTMPDSPPADPVSSIGRTTPAGFTECCAAVFIAWSVGALFLAVGPSYAENLLRTGNHAQAGAATFLVFAAAFGGELLSGRLSETRCVKSGIGFLVAGLASTVLAFPTRSPVVLAAAAVLCGVGVGLTFLGSLAYVNRSVLPAQRAKLTARYFAWLFLGNVIPVVLVGLLADRIGLAPAVCAFAAVMTASAVLTYLRFSRIESARRNERLRSPLREGLRTSP